jgi:hypothetical protein
VAPRGSRRLPKLNEVYHTTRYLPLKSKLQMLLYRPVFPGRSADWHLRRAAA